jgi:hypothetical protein
VVDPDGRLDGHLDLGAHPLALDAQALAPGGAHRKLFQQFDVPAVEAQEIAQLRVAVGVALAQLAEAERGVDPEPMVLKQLVAHRFVEVLVPRVKGFINPVVVALPRAPDVLRLRGCAGSENSYVVVRLGHAVCWRIVSTRL